jgi:hypothetical protein
MNDDVNLNDVIYPNPFIDFLTIKTEIFTSPIKVDVFNIGGNLILSKFVDENNYQINLGDLEKGIYLFRITVKDDVIEKKVIKL